MSGSLTANASNRIILDNEEIKLIMYMYDIVVKCSSNNIQGYMYMTGQKGTSLQVKPFADKDNQKKNSQGQYHSMVTIWNLICYKWGNSHNIHNFNSLAKNAPQQWATPPDPYYVM